MALKILFIFAHILLFIFILDFEVTEGRRGGGGGRYGGSRISTGYRSNVRYGSVRNSYGGTRVRVRTGSYRPWGSGYYYNNWQTAAMAGYIAGYHGYSRRSYYHSHRDREPTICYNEYDYSLENGTKAVYFICPDLHQPDSYRYCCGEEDKQKCCTFWDDAGRVFSVIGGVLFVLVLFSVTIWCCCCRKVAGKQPFFQERVMSRRSVTRPGGTSIYYTPANPGPIITDIPPPVSQPVYPQNFTTQPIYPQNNDQPSYPPMPHPDANTQPLYPPNPNYGTTPPYPTGGPGYPPGPEYSPVPGYSPQPDPSYQNPAQSMYPAQHAGYAPPHYDHAKSGLAPSAPPDNVMYPVSPPPPYPM